MPHRIHAAPTALDPPNRPVKQHGTTTWGFAIWWILLLLLHGVNVIYFAGAAIIYRMIRLGNLTFQLTTYSIGINPTEYPKVSTIYAIIAALHGALMIRMIVGSIQARQLKFTSTLLVWLSRVISNLANSHHQQSNRVWCRLLHRLWLFFQAVWMAFKSVFGRKGLFGVDGLYFEYLHLWRELIETTLQIIQVYRMTYLLPRLMLIRFYVVLLVLNCWSTPLVHRFYRDHHTKRLLMALVCDAVLDMMASSGVSFIIFATYAPQYTDPVSGFPFANWYDDLWFTSMAQEFQIMLVSSWADMAVILVFAIGLLQCMSSIKTLLTPIKPQQPDITTKGSATTIGGATVVPVHPQPQQAVAPTNHSSRVGKLITDKAGPTFFAVLGLAILIVHIVADTRASSASLPCQLTLHPWFVSKPACSLVELDCYQLGGISGSQESLQHAWSAFEFNATARIFVRHCPQLEIPSTILRFHQITSIKLYNCTIASWSTNAALTSTAHPQLRSIFAIRTNFLHGELPPGLMTTEFPKHLKAFITSATNLVTLPDHLYERWPSGLAICLELSQLQEIPSTLSKMNASAMSFSGCAIPTVPAEIFESPNLLALGLSNTRIQELPRIVPHPSPHLYILFLDGTNVSTFWSWMDPLLHLQTRMEAVLVNARHAPFCIQRDEILAGNRSSFAITKTEPNAEDLATVMDMSTPTKRDFARAMVQCDSDGLYYFPLPLQDARSAIHQ